MFHSRYYFPYVISFLKLFYATFLQHRISYSILLAPKHSIYAIYVWIHILVSFSRPWTTQGDELCHILFTPWSLNTFIICCISLLVTRNVVKTLYLSLKIIIDTQRESIYVEWRHKWQALKEFALRQLFSEVLKNEKLFISCFRYLPILNFYLKI